MSKFHMGNQDNEIINQELIQDMLKKGKVITLALTDGINPYIVTLSYGYDSSCQAIYMHCSKNGLKIEYIRKNPLACATIIEDHGYVQDDCTQKYRSLVIWGKVSIINDLTEKKHGFAVLFKHLEGENEKISQKMMADESVYHDVGMLRLDIEQIDAKGNI